MEPAEYRRLAEVEDEMWYFRALHAHLSRELHRNLGGGRPWHVLDAGCGTGGLIRRLQPLQPGWRWTGVDASDLACRLARERVPGGNVVQARLEALPFPAATFDAVVCADVLYHLHDDEVALRELARVLRPGGCLVVNVPAHRWLWSYHDVAVHAVRRYDRAELRTKVERAGLQVNRLTHWNTLLLPVLAVRRKLLPAPAGGSDVHSYPSILDAGFRGATWLEQLGLASGVDFPCGSSLLAVAHKTA